MMRCLLLLFSLSLPAIAHAEKIRLGSLPQKVRAAGFQANVYVDGLAGPGYQPVYIEFLAVNGSFPAVRNLQLIVSPHAHSDTELDFDLRQEVQLPQGARSHEVRLLVPRYYTWHALSFRILEEGDLIDTGKATVSLSQNRLQPTGLEVAVGILTARDAAALDAPWKTYPDIRTLTAVLGDGPLPEDASVMRLSHSAAKQMASSVQPAKVQYRPIEEDALHTNWLGYSQLDILLVAAPLLQRIDQEQPDRRSAIDNWVAAGGSLWIYAADATTPELLSAGILQAPSSAALLPQSKLRNMLNLSDTNDTSGWDYNWNSGAYRESDHYNWQPTNNNSLKQRGTVFADLQQAEHPFLAKLKPNAFQERVRHGKFGLGTITTIAEDDPFPGAYLFWKSIHRLRPEDQSRWVGRNGIDVPSGDAKYWSHLLESVGQPPVKSFILLNTLFVIAIGPVCYFFFRRRERLYLLFFFAPAIALFVTGSLFAYALVSDGIRTRAQVKTVTWIDPQAEMACQESHHTYYAVIGGRSGLRFPAQAMVSPVRGMPLAISYRSANHDRLQSKIFRMTEEGQQFQGAFLPSRDQVQYLTRQPKQKSPYLRVNFAASAKAPELKNPFPYALRRILLRDPQQQYWAAETIEPGETKTLQSVHAANVRSFMRDPLLSTTVFADTPPTAAPTLNSWNRVNRRYRGYVDERSQLDDRLLRWHSSGLPPNSFWAIAAPPPETLAVESAVVDQVHVVMGELP